MNPTVKKLYTREELESKIKEYTEKYEKHKSKNDYEFMTFICNDIARCFEIKEEKEKAEFYYQEIVDIWHIHPGKFVDWKCVGALRLLQRPEEALKIVLSNPSMWGVETLAHLYEELNRKEEAIIIYSSLATFSFKLSEAYYPFWRPHYLQEAADLYEKAQDIEMVRRYNERAVEAWEEIKDNIKRPLYAIEEAWLYEEVGYIYEKASKLEIAAEYYQRAQSRYGKAHSEEPHIVAAHHIDGDWKDYLGFFTYQIPDFRLIHFDSLEENDCRRIKYRILNLEKQMK